MSVSSISPMQGPINIDTPPELEAELSGLNPPADSPIAETSEGADTASEDSQTKDNLIRLMDYLQKRRAQKFAKNPLGRALQTYETVSAGYLDTKGHQFNREG